MMAEGLPDFLGIGAQRAGTTWLHNCLKEHPALCLPSKKELHFFDTNYENGLQWYREKFEPQQGQLVGEITPNYYHHKDALARIKQDLPDVKLIYIIREPISRAVSQYELYKDNEFEGRTLEQLVDQKESLIEFSLQGKHLEHIYQQFDKSNVLVLFYDELNTQPEVFVKKVYEFLGVDSNFVPQFLNKRVNRVVFPRLQAFLKAIGLKWFIRALRRSPLAEPIKNMSKTSSKPSLNQQLSEKLTTVFREDIQLIERLTNCKLDHWK